MLSMYSTDICHAGSDLVNTDKVMKNSAQQGVKIITSPWGDRSTQSLQVDDGVEVGAEKMLHEQQKVIYWMISHLVIYIQCPIRAEVKAWAAVLKKHPVCNHAASKHHGSLL